MKRYTLLILTLLLSACSLEPEVSSGHSKTEYKETPTIVFPALPHLTPQQNNLPSSKTIKNKITYL